MTSLVPTLDSFVNPRSEVFLVIITEANEVSLLRYFCILFVLTTHFNALARVGTRVRAREHTIPLKRESERVCALIDAMDACIFSARSATGATNEHSHVSEAANSSFLAWRKTCARRVHGCGCVVWCVRASALAVRFNYAVVPSLAR